MRVRLAAIAVALLGTSEASAQHLPVAVPDSTIIAASEDSLAQLRDVSDLLRSILGRSVKASHTSHPEPGLTMTLLPNGGYNHATGAFIGASVALGGWLGEPVNTTLSSGSPC